jgi:sortase A
VLPTAALPAASPLPATGVASLPPAKVLSIPAAAPDMSLWSAVRIRDYKASLARDPGSPLAILRIPKQRIEVAVLPGTEDWILDRGAGNIEETALPGKPGNVGIAGHRDGYFRTLEHIAKGDPLELETPWGVESYRVTDIRIVEQEDVQVLDPTPHPTVTLVTCYPFYFNGHAPKRFIVRAESAAP